MRKYLAIGFLGLALAAMLFVLAIVRGEGAAKAPGVIPWIPDLPVQLTERRELARPCHARDLRADLGLQGGLGNQIGGLRVTKLGREPCSLVGRPDVHFEGGPARAVYVRVVTARSENILWRNPLPFRFALRALRPGEQAWAGLLWSNWCPPGTETTSLGAAPAELVLTLPRSGSELRFPAGRPPRCDGGVGSNSTVAVEPF